MLQPSPSFNITQAERIATDLFGVEGSAKPLDSERDQNFKIIARNGKKFVLKIASTEEYISILDAQNKAMTTVANANIVACPTAVKALSGKEIEISQASDGRQFFTRLVTFIDGNFMADLPKYSAKMLYGLGRVMGRIDKALADFNHPAAYRDFPWDLKISHAQSTFTDKIKVPARRRLVEYFLLQFEAEFLPKFRSLRSSVIHNDANDYNVMVSGDEVTGIIDFGDMVHSNTISELAVTCAYAMLDSENPLQVAAQVVEGYNSANTISHEEIEVLFQLICARLCVSVIMSARRKELEPENEYLSVSEKPAWDMLERLISVNPNRAVQIFCDACKVSSDHIYSGYSKNEIAELRKNHLGQSFSIAYKQPLKITRGAMQYLFEEDGRTFLDCVNNVCHVGHCNPKVVKAAQKQIAKLNTNTRYLHDNIVEFAQRLKSKFPEKLSVCFFVNSGSEANDLALRIARTYTQQKELLTLDHAYHGNLGSLIDISPYKHNRAGGQGAPLHVHTITLPDLYRGEFKAGEPEAAAKYAKQAAEKIKKLTSENNSPAAFIAESLPSCGGQIVLPDGYLRLVYQQVRAGGGVCIADEVQVGFGRVGEKFWGFETQEVVPDIVTIGKPIGNGHPLAAVVTTLEIADAFANGMEYFNTFGGNPVSCAVGLAVLETIKTENLQQNALEVGNFLKTGLLELKEKYSLIGDVRGKGLFLGAELVLDHETLEPATTKAGAIIEDMKERGVLLSTDGPLDNVLKIKPPIIFTRENAEHVLKLLDETLAVHS